MIRMLKICTNNEVKDVTYNPEKEIIGSACFGEGNYAELVRITNNNFFYDLEVVDIDFYRNDIVMLVDEEGVLKYLPINHTACVLANKIIVGDVCIARLRDNDIVDFSDSEYSALKDYFTNYVDRLLYIVY